MKDHPCRDNGTQIRKQIFYLLKRGDALMDRIQDRDSKKSETVPIRREPVLDRKQVLAGENGDMPGYDTLGRLFAIGYLRGLLEGIGNAERKG